MRIVLGGLAAVISAAVAVAFAGASVWERAAGTEMALLTSAPRPPAAFDAASLDEAPAPVARYLRKAISDGHAIVREAVTSQAADFYLNGGWRRLRAIQKFTIEPPGFVWDANIEMAPLMPVLVRDSYVNQRARMRASLFGLYTIVDQANTPELNSGALQRFLGESIWFPTALLPSDTIAWTARDTRSASVTLTDGPNRATLLFEFGDDDLPRRISGDRYKEDNGTYSIHLWEISCGESAIRDGLTIPLSCEVSWIVNGVKQPYWRGRISTIEYHYDVME